MSTATPSSSAAPPEQHAAPNHGEVGAETPPGPAAVTEQVLVTTEAPTTTAPRPHRNRRRGETMPSEGNPPQIDADGQAFEEAQRQEAIRRAAAQAEADRLAFEEAQRQAAIRAQRMAEMDADEARLYRQRSSHAAEIEAARQRDADERAAAAAMAQRVQAEIEAKIRLEYAAQLAAMQARLAEVSQAANPSLAPTAPPPPPTVAPPVATVPTAQSSTAPVVAPNGATSAPLLASRSLDLFKQVAQSAAVQQAVTDYAPKTAQAVKTAVKTAVKVHQDVVAPPPAVPAPAPAPPTTSTAAVAPAAPSPVKRKLRPADASSTAVARAPPPPPAAPDDDDDDDETVSFEAEDDDEEEEEEEEVAPIAPNVVPSSLSARQASTTAMQQASQLGSTLRGRGGPPGTTSSNLAASSSRDLLSSSSSRTAPTNATAPPQPTTAPPLPTPPPPAPASLRQIFSNESMSGDIIHLAQQLPSGHTLTAAYTFGVVPSDDFEVYMPPNGDAPSQEVELRRLETPREEGRCLGPHPQEPGADAAEFSHQKFTVDFYRAMQTVVVPSKELKELSEPPGPVDPSNPISRERRAKGQLPLSAATFAFDTANADPAAMKRAAAEAPLVPATTVANNAVKALKQVTNAYSTCDVVQLYETSTNARARNSEYAGKLYTLDYEPTKAVPQVPWFNNGVLYSMDFKSCVTNLEQLHGSELDPQWGSMAIHLITNTQALRISETFYFDVNAGRSALYKDTPQHPAHAMKRCLTFIPNELKNARLHLVFRLYRLATEDQDSSLDMYIRPGAWRDKHFPDHRGKIRQYAGASRILSEVGWHTVQLSTATGLYTGEGFIDKLFVSPKLNSTSDADVYKATLDPAVRNALKSITVRVAIDFQDVTGYEVSVPRTGMSTTPLEEETIINIRNPKVATAPREVLRYTPPAVPLLNAGFFSTYFNVLYVRLKHANLTKLVLKTAAPVKHYVIRVALKDRDDDLTNAEGLPCVYTKRLTPNLIETSGWSNVTVNYKEADYNDEFKIQLPLVLTEKHHLLFTFYGVPFDKTAGVREPIAVGYSVLPLFVNNSVVANDNIKLPVLLADGSCNVARNGYLMRLGQLPPTASVAGGQSVFELGTSVRSSVYAPNQLMADVLATMGRFTKMAVDTGVKGSIYATTGNVLSNKVETNAETEMMKLLQQIEKMPSPETMAYFPQLVSFLLVVMSAPSYAVGVAVRCTALKSLTSVLKLVHETETNAAKRQRMSSTPGSPGTRGGSMPGLDSGILVTSAVKILYHWLGNDLLFDGKTRFNVAYAVTEILTGELRRINKVPGLGEYRNRIGSLLWFYLDLILKSLYLQAHIIEPRPAPVPPPAPGAKKTRTAATLQQTPPPMINARRTRTQMVHSSFYGSVTALINEIIHVLVQGENAMVVTRTSLFLRHLLRVLDRGQVLNIYGEYIKALARNHNQASVELALRILCESESLPLLIGPLTTTDLSPRGISRVILRRVVTTLCSDNRSARLSAGSILIGIISRACATTKAVTSDHITNLACSFFAVIPVLCYHYAALRSMIDKVESTGSASTPTGPSSALALAEKRGVLVVVLWIIQNCPADGLRAFVAGIREHRTLNGLVLMLGDCMSVFRYNAKAPPAAAKPDAATPSEAQAWEQRVSAQVYVLCLRTVSMVLAEHGPGLLRDVAMDRPHSAVYNFFGALEGCVNVSNPAQLLLAGCALLKQTSDELLPEIYSGRGLMAPGMVLVSLRLMTCAVPAVRQAAGLVYLDLARRHYDLIGNLGKFHHLTSNGIVAVADTPGRDLNQAGEYIADGFGTLVELAQKDDSPPYSDSTRMRYIPAQADALSTSGKNKRPAAPPLATSKSLIKAPKPVYCSVVPSFRVPPGPRSKSAAKPGEEDDEDTPKTFAAEFERLADQDAALFSSVVKLQSGAAVSNREIKSLAYVDVIKTFVQQCCLADIVRWLSRLLEMHRSAGDMLEAGMTSVALAAVGYRSSQLFYHVYGKDAQGAKLPYGFLCGYLHWHDFVRLCPVVDELFSEEETHAMVSDIGVLPEDKVFTIDGQLLYLKQAAEYFFTAQQYETAVSALRCVDAVAHYRDDYASIEKVADSMSKWARLAQGADGKRHVAKYFGFSARGGRLQEPLQLIFRYASTSTMDLVQFQRYVKQVIITMINGTENDVTMAQYTSAEEAVRATELAAAAATAARKGRRNKAALQAAAVLDHRVSIACYEVQPYYEESDPRVDAKPYEKHNNVRQFSFAMRILDPDLVDQIAKSTLTKAQAQQMSDAAKSLDVAAQRLRVVVHTVERPLPSITSAVRVMKSIETTLDPVVTAMQTIHQQKDILFSVSETGEPNQVLAATYAALVPQDIRPAGYYFKEVVRVHGPRVPTVLEACKDFLTHVKTRADRATAAAAKSPERFAAITKGWVDIECAITDAMAIIAAEEAARAEEDAATHPDPHGDDDHEALPDETSHTNTGGRRTTSYESDHEEEEEEYEEEEEDE